MKVGDIVKFAKEHYVDSPGHEYVKDWMGIVVEIKATGFHHPIDEMLIWWTEGAGGGNHVSHYDELWWNKLEHEPFEVIDESYKN